MRILLVRKTVAAQFSPPKHCISHLNGKFGHYQRFPRNLTAFQFVRTMCQAHENSEPGDSSNGLSTSGQPSQSNQKQKQRPKEKQEKQRLARETTPPATPRPPTHEIVKSASSKLANGTRYVDVCHSAKFRADPRHIAMR